MTPLCDCWNMRYPGARKEEFHQKCVKDEAVGWRFVRSSCLPLAASENGSVAWLKMVLKVVKLLFKNPPASR